MTIKLGTETLLGKVVRIYYGKCYIIHGQFSDITLSREEVEKILLKKHLQKNDISVIIMPVNELRK